MNPKIDIREDIRLALERGEPVVALESTIIAHGMPYPENLAMAEQVEAMIREEGAHPATIAVIDGVIKVGLTNQDMDYLARGENVLKLSKRDLAFAVAQKRTGATTVSATMIIAAMANIRVFATGGIGGVHRGASKSMDISRDLEELAEVEMAVVCAGIKSILDIGLTLEYLETKGVEVIGYQTDHLPAFYTRNSEFKLEIRLDTPEAIAELMHVKWSLSIKGGIVIANPIPAADSMPLATIDNIISSALEEAEDRGIAGKHITPFLLDYVKQLSAGDSLKANIALVLNNARVAAQIAKQYALR